MENSVVDTSQPRFLRAYAWLKLVRVWAALRADDVQGLLPETVKIFEKGLQATLDRTKTSGPGKKIRWMKIYISQRSYIAVGNWLAEGLAIWDSADFAVKRDYFLLAPSKDLQ
eukprot:3687151-Karenia_brevis.AAC.1